MDRNGLGIRHYRDDVSSLSARRAWIEIPAGCWRDARRAVALRKESVDRNATVNTVIFCIMGSLSARRAWIEILVILAKQLNGTPVALRKESVDRNPWYFPL